MSWYLRIFENEVGQSYPQDVLVGDQVVQTTIMTSDVFHIELQQLIDGFSVEHAAVTIAVDTSNDLLDIHSTFRPEEPIGSGKPRLTVDQAEAVALKEVGLTEADLDQPAAPFAVWVPVDGNLELAWKVSLKPNDDTGLLPSMVTVLDRTGEVRDSIVTVSSSCAPILTETPQGAEGFATPEGLRDGIGNAYVATPAGATSRAPMRFEINPADPSSLLVFSKELSDVPLRDMCVYQGPFAPYVNGAPLGEFVRVQDAQGGAQLSPDYDLRVASPLGSTLRFDSNLDGNASPSTVPIDIGSIPPDVDLTPADDDNEKRLDETMAYYYVDNQARFFSDHFHHTLSRAANVDPSIEIHVNASPGKGVGTDNSDCEQNVDYRASADSVFDIGNTGRRYDLVIKIGKGHTLIPFFDNWLGLDDIYALSDQSRDGTTIAHEFSHAMIFDVADLDNGTPGVGGAFHEGMADYFAATNLDRTTVVDWPFVGRSMEDISGRPFLAGLDTPGTEVHANSPVFSRSFWDLRDRLQLLSSELPFFNGPRTADHVAWGALQRVGSTVSDYREALADSLAADNDIYNKALDYEILAAFADHGVKLQPAIAVIRPEHFVLDARKGPVILNARGYLGSNTSYIAEFATDPKLLGGVFGPNPNRKPGINYININSSDPSAPPVVPISVLHPTDTENYVADFTLSQTQLDALAQGGQSAAIFMQLTTFVPGQPFTYGEITGAGQFMLGADDPGTIYIPAGSSCNCSLARTNASSAVPFGTLLLLSGVVFFRRRWHA